MSEEKKQSAPPSSWQRKAAIGGVTLAGVAVVVGILYATGLIGKKKIQSKLGKDGKTMELIMPKDPIVWTAENVFPAVNIRTTPYPLLWVWKKAGHPIPTPLIEGVNTDPEVNKKHKLNIDGGWIRDIQTETDNGIFHIIRDFDSKLRVKIVTGDKAYRLSSDDEGNVRLTDEERAPDSWKMVATPSGIQFQSNFGHWLSMKGPKLVTVTGQDHLNNYFNLTKAPDL